MSLMTRNFLCGVPPVKGAANKTPGRKNRIQQHVVQRIEQFRALCVPSQTATMLVLKSTFRFTQAFGGKGFAERLSASGTACPPLEGRHTAISSCINRKAVKGTVGRSEVNPLPPEARRRLARTSLVTARYCDNHLTYTPDPARRREAYTGRQKGSSSFQLPLASHFFR